MSASGPIQIFRVKKAPFTWMERYSVNHQRSQTLDCKLTLRVDRKCFEIEMKFKQRRGERESARRWKHATVQHESKKAATMKTQLLVTNQQVLKSCGKEDEQLRCHPIHNPDVPRKSEKERTNEKRKWKTVDNCSENRTWPDVKLLLWVVFFFLFIKKK